ncbi:MAG TPA: phosphoribosylformylglycinamidine synthase subunit PurQ [Deinococcales bacterium]|nr:phosphoribosylformylglycinamidine synthase subunit PurQ [Deinococcales bacterium]
MRVAVVQFPGSNCDDDARHVLGDVLGQDARLVWHAGGEIGDVDAVVIPGGFSYGDHLRSGAIAARSPVMTAVRDFAVRGGPVIGICNGFQVLTEAGLLPGALLPNECTHFLCQDVTLRVERADTPFTGAYQAGDVLRIPIAHNEGNYTADPETLARLEGEGRVVFRYLDNPNGSLNDIAGIVNERGNVLGLMPHPERASEAELGSSDGLGVFRSLIDSATR